MTDKDLKPIDGCDGYHVSKDGRIYSDHSRRFLKPGLSNGYRLINLGGKTYSVHVVVATAFLGERPFGCVVNHKNCDRSDNRVENLEWVTQSYNVKHAYENGRRIIDAAHKKRAAIIGRLRRSFTEEQKASIQSEYSGRRGEITALSEKYGISRWAVSDIVGELK